MRGDGFEGMLGMFSVYFVGRKNGLQVGTCVSSAPVYR